MLARKAARFADAEAVVRPILDAVRTRGDKALLEYARKFDQLDRASVAVKPAELLAAEKTLSPKFRSAVKTASKNIRAFAKLQLPVAKQAVIAPGIRVGQIVRPLDTVAAYIPSGRYPLPSTLMMTVIPAQVAGVEMICAATPRPVAEVFGTASLLKGDRFCCWTDGDSDDCRRWQSEMDRGGYAGAGGA
jgi:histidinol dehydrogenase